MEPWVHPALCLIRFLSDFFFYVMFYNIALNKIVILLFSFLVVTQWDLNVLCEIHFTNINILCSYIFLVKIILRNRSLVTIKILMQLHCSRDLYIHSGTLHITSTNANHNLININWASRFTYKSPCQKKIR